MHPRYLNVSWFVANENRDPVKRRNVIFFFFLRNLLSWGLSPPLLEGLLKWTAQKVNLASQKHHVCSKKILPDGEYSQRKIGEKGSEDKEAGVLMREKAQNRGQSGSTSHRHCKDTAKEGSPIPAVLEGTELHCREKVLSPPSAQVHTQTQTQKGHWSCQGESMGIEALGTNKRRKKTAQSPEAPCGRRTHFSVKN